MESDSEEEEDEEVVVGMEQRSASLLHKVYTGNLQVGYMEFTLFLNYFILFL